MTRSAQGYRRNETERRIVIGFDDETFAEIKQRAVKSRTSFAAEVRLLVETGLETVKGGY